MNNKKKDSKGALYWILMIGATLVIFGIISGLMDEGKKKSELENKQGEDLLEYCMKNWGTKSISDIPYKCLVELINKNYE